MFTHPRMGIDWGRSGFQMASRSVRTPTARVGDHGMQMAKGASGTHQQPLWPASAEQV